MGPKFCLDILLPRWPGSNDLFPDSGTETEIELDRSRRKRSVMIFFFSATTLITLIRSLLHMCLSDGGAQSIATIPLGDYKQLVDARTCADTEPGSECAGNIVAVFAQWGWCQLLMGFVYVVVLWRYRSLIPLMWLFIGVEWAGRAAIGATKPVYADSTPPGARANILFPILAFGMLGWALLGSGNSKVHGAPGEDEKR